MKERDLAELLQSCFDPNQLLRLLRGREEMTRVIPAVNWAQSSDAVAEQVVSQLVREGVVTPALFDALSETRAGRARDIEEVRRQWFPPPAPRRAPDPELHPLLHAHDPVTVKVERVFRFAPDAMYGILRDRLVEVSGRMPTVATCEELYRREHAPGVWSGFWWQYHYGADHPVFGPLVGAVAPVWMELGTAATQHGSWDDHARIACWNWENPIFGAREVLEFLPEPGGCRVRVFCKFWTFLPMDPIPRSMAKGVWAAMRPLQPGVLTQNIEDVLLAAAAVLGDEPPGGGT
jgi:hypothetical protein